MVTKTEAEKAKNKGGGRRSLVAGVAGSTGHAHGRPLGIAPIDGVEGDDLGVELPPTKEEIDRLIGLYRDAHPSDPLELNNPVGATVVTPTLTEAEAKALQNELPAATPQQLAAVESKRAKTAAYLATEDLVPCRPGTGAGFDNAASRSVIINRCRYDLPVGVISMVPRSVAAAVAAANWASDDTPEGLAAKAATGGKYRG
jgi:hypothetical protein